MESYKQNFIEFMVRAGVLTFVKMVTEFRDAEGNLRAEAILTGVEASKDSPFLSVESATTRPWNRRVEVAITVSPLAAFSWLPMHRLQPGRSR